jgi:hypothetical protein
MNGDHKAIQMRLLPQTIDRIERLSKIMKNDNKTSVVGTSLKMTEELIDYMIQGKLYVHETNGDQFNVTLDIYGK